MALAYRLDKLVGYGFPFYGLGLWLMAYGSRWALWRAAEIVGDGMTYAMSSFGELQCLLDMALPYGLWLMARDGLFGELHSTVWLGCMADGSRWGPRLL